jgi:hypothetical protein
MSISQRQGSKFSIRCGPSACSWGRPFHDSEAFQARFKTRPLLGGTLAPRDNRVNTLKGESHVTRKEIDDRPDGCRAHRCRVLAPQLRGPADINEYHDNDQGPPTAQNALRRFPYDHGYPLIRRPGLGTREGRLPGGLFRILTGLRSQHPCYRLQKRGALEWLAKHLDRTEQAGELEHIRCAEVSAPAYGDDSHA